MVKETISKSTEPGPNVMTNGILVKSALMRTEKHLVIPINAMQDFETEYILVMYVKSKKTLQIIGINEMRSSPLVDLTFLSKKGGENFTRFPVIFAREFLAKNGSEILWTNGICTPTGDDLKKIGIEGMDLTERSCIWEGILWLPTGMDMKEFVDKIKGLDKENVLTSIDIKRVESIMPEIVK